MVLKQFVYKPEHWKGVLGPDPTLCLPCTAFILKTESLLIGLASKELASRLEVGS